MSACQACAGSGLEQLDYHCAKQSCLRLSCVNVCSSKGLHVFRPVEQLERLLIKWGSGSKNCSRVNPQTETPNFENVFSQVQRKATAWQLSERENDHSLFLSVEFKRQERFLKNIAKEIQLMQLTVSKPASHLLQKWGEFWGRGW